MNEVLDQINPAQYADTGFTGVEQHVSDEAIIADGFRLEPKTDLGKKFQVAHKFLRSINSRPEDSEPEHDDINLALSIAKGNILVAVLGQNGVAEYYSVEPGFDTEMVRTFELQGYKSDEIYIFNPHDEMAI